MNIPSMESHLRSLCREKRVSLFFRIFICLAIVAALNANGESPRQACAGTPAVESASTPAKTVRVGYVESPRFMKGKSDADIKSGMAYDYLQKVSYYTNWSYIYVYGDWDTILNKLYRGEIDVMAGVSKTPEREGRLLFPEYTMGSENYYIFTYADRPLASLGLPGIAGYTVSVNRNTIMDDILRQWNDEGNHQINITTYGGNEERYRAFHNYQADATVDTDNAVFQEDNMVPIALIGKSDFYLAVNKERPDLVEDLNAALTKINSINPSFTGKLANDYFSGLAVTSTLQADELDWIIDHPTITVGYVDDYLPLSDQDEKGQAIGVIRDVLQEITLKLNIQDRTRLTYIPYKSYEAMIDALQEGAVDVAFPVNNDVAQAEKDGLYLSSEVISTPMYLVYTGEYNDLALHRMAAKRDNSIGDIYIHAHFPNVELVYYDDINEVLDAVKNGDVDGCVLNQFRKDSYLLHADYSTLKTVTLNDYPGRSFAVKHGNNKLLSILNRGITCLPPEFGLTSTYAYTGKNISLTFKDYVMQNLFPVLTIAGIITAVLGSLIAYIVLMHRNRKELQHIAHHDSLTGLLNRRSYNEFMKTNGKKFLEDSVIILAMDLNDLKATNDTLGHDAGDELLVSAANCMKKVLSPYGSVYRIGGDEFVAVIEADQEKLPEIVETLRAAFREWSISHDKNLTVSIGSACSSAPPKLTLNEMISTADREMYKDKAAYYDRRGIDRRHRR